MINNRLILSLLIILTAVSLSGCDLAAGIFKAGMWTTVIIIVVVIALILWLVGKSRR